MSSVAHIDGVNCVRGPSRKEQGARTRILEKNIEDLTLNWDGVTNGEVLGE